ncbi:katanin-interacting protein-like isoform X1 [Schistocerca serialis cubense]|uniref:katanin-interacting protein-like isoform X1 n=1 Tax=Schistocerca serialis cubense TaxID=2023355 RepID=UPI00214ECAB7|nr:katanin-interacting protein-like isoform X1 [Schistocerca serialis cubense]
MDSSSLKKVPKWLEEISANTQQQHPGSWAPSQNYDLKKSKSARLPKSAELFGTQCGFSDLDGTGTSCRISDNQLKVQRSKSACYGRRSSAGSWSAGDSPRSCLNDVETDIQLLQTTLRQNLAFPEISSAVAKPSLEESWSSLCFFDQKHKGRLTETEVPVSSEIPVLDKEIPQDAKNKDKPTLSSDFIIPELPGGTHLAINIKSTWGDRHYLGLNGIEIFSGNGEPVDIQKISADPADINILPEYGKDPRVVTNLLDGVNRTHDDMHLWLAPFTPGSNHFIYISFKQYTQVAMIRIWNYNKSRIHSFRGARDVEITLDNRLIFCGEIARASGGILGGTEAFGDTILFTTDDSILESVSHCDNSFTSIVTHSELDVNNHTIERPLTADTGEERPFTCAQQLLPPAETIFDVSGMDVCLSGSIIEINLLQNWGHPALIGLTGLEVVDDSGEALYMEPYYLHCSIPSPDIYRLIDGINITTDDSHMWSTGFLSGEPVTLTLTYPENKKIAGLRLWNFNASPDMVYCGVKIISVHLDGKLVVAGVDGIIPIRRAPGNCHFNFVQELKLSGSPVAEPVDADREEYSNTKDQHDSPLSSSFEFDAECQDHGAMSCDRRNENNATLDSLNIDYPLNSAASDSALSNISQLPCSNSELNKVKNEENGLRLLPPPVSIRYSDNSDLGDEEYEAPVMPEGFVFQLLILSTWGDMYYVGLNGLELYDEYGKKIRLTENNIGAHPDSVNVLEGVEGDVRTPEKLVDGVNDTLDGQHMWLAPILPDELNRVYIVFDYPVKVSMIKLWNYAKTPSRGVKEFGILVDDLLVYNGELDQASHLQGSSRVPYRTVLFTLNSDLISQEQSTEVRHKGHGHHVRLLNDYKRVTSGGSSCTSADPSLRPVTSIVHREMED